VGGSSDPATHAVEAVQRDDLPRIARAIARADAVVVAGGTVFKTLHPSTGRPPLALLRQAAALAAVARGMRKPLALVGVGADTLHGRTARALARTIIHAANLLILRDEESAAELAGIGAPTPFRVGADAAWTLLPNPPGPTSPGESIIVALSHLAGDRDLADWLATGLEPFADVPIRLDPWQPPHDVALATEVARRLGGRVAVSAPPRDLLAARDSMLGARLVIAQRFHALVAAASAGVPAVAVAHEPKLAGLGRRLGQPTVAPGGQLAAAIAAGLAADPPVPDAVHRERALAEDGFRLLRVLLTRGRSDEAADVDGLVLRPQEWVG
jgi:polysaccharide pyruvyl transferase WcaK-like protein